MIDLALGKIEVPQEKLAALQQSLYQACQMALMPAKQLASIVGRIISMGLAIGPVIRFMTRSLYAGLETRQAWCELLGLSPEARAELRFWLASLAEYITQPIWHSPSARGSCILMLAILDMGGRLWSMVNVCHLDSGQLMKLVKAPRGGSSPWCTECCWLWHANSPIHVSAGLQNVARILQVGSRKPHLQKMHDLII